MGRVVVFTCVRNEADDIGWWIAHHLAAGAASLVIYDDFSDDGTWSILQAAQASGHVVARRTDPSLPPGNRAGAALRDAIARDGGAADWFGILEPDDYVVFDDAATLLPAALDRIVGGDAVALSRCVFGASAQIQKPRLSPVRAYDRHAPADFPDHARAVLFLRGQALDAGRIDDDFHGAAPDRIMTITASPAVIRDHGRIQPDWAVARARKYACRSMAHFVDRTRLLSQHGLSDWWRHYDRNEDGGHMPEGDGKAERIAAGIYRELWGRTILRAQLSGVLNAGSGAAVDRATDAEAYSIHGERGVVAYDPVRRGLRATSVEMVESGNTRAEGLEPVLAFRWASIPDWVVLARVPDDNVAGQDVFEQGSTGLLIGLMPLRARSAGSDAVALQMPFNGRYMTAIPDTGDISFDRQEVQGWERFLLHPATTTQQARERMGGIAALASRGLTAQGLRDGLGDVAIEQGEALGAVFAMLPPGEQQQMILAYPGCFPVWLRGPGS